MEQSQGFHKRAVAFPAMLKKTLMIEFSGEEGADAGALFFECSHQVMQQVREEYFEGEEGRKVIKCHWGGATELEMAGAMVAHSLLRGGPGLPCLHPAMFELMVLECTTLTSLTPEQLPTADLLELIDKVCPVYKPVFFVFITINIYIFSVGQCRHYGESQ